MISRFIENLVNLFDSPFWAALVMPAALVGVLLCWTSTFNKEKSSMVRFLLILGLILMILPIATSFADTPKIGLPNPAYEGPAPAAEPQPILPTDDAVEPPGPAPGPCKRVFTLPTACTPVIPRACSPAITEGIRVQAKILPVRFLFNRQSREKSVKVQKEVTKSARPRRVRGAVVQAGPCAPAAPMVCEPAGGCGCDSKNAPRRARTKSKMKARERS